MTNLEKVRLGFGLLTVLPLACLVAILVIVVVASSPVRGPHTETLLALATGGALAVVARLAVTRALAGVTVARSVLGEAGDVEAWLGRPSREALVVEAERARRQAEADLAFQKFALDEASIVAITDVRGTITYVNDKFCEISGYSRDELIGQNHRVINSDFHPASFFREMYRTIASGRVWRGEIRNRRKDGTFYWVDTTIVPSMGPDGRPERYVAIRNDITERKAVEAALREADRTKDDFLAMLAHELRNPLAPIRTSVELLRRLLPRDARVERARETIDRQVDHLVRLVDDLLDVSRVSRGKLTLQLDVVDLREVVEQAVETNHTSIDRRRQHLVLSMPPEPVRVNGDFTRLAQVVGNLLGNAAKYTDVGGHVWVSVEEVGPPPAAIVRVRDTGRGIEPELLARLFEPFYQVAGDRDRSEGGLGIGLALVKSLVELHGGTVEAHSEGRGRGSELVVQLPRVEGPAASAPDGAQVDVAPPRGLDVLVIDDSPDSGESIAMLLELDGHRVSLARDGGEGLAKALDGRPDAVLLDLSLPVIDGYEVCRRIRAAGRAEPLIVAMTGFAEDRHRQRAADAGFDGFEPKPVDLASLRARLAEHARRLG
ncbi:ATP-binding protein [Myxococcota bacterium]|nr:ATP-binding protein [Myxococcota bacterium]